MSNVPATQSDLRSMIGSEAYKRQWAMVLPKHLTPDRMARVALTALTKTPKLMECTQESVMSCLLDCAAMGIEPDGRRAHLIPYGNKCTLIIDYKGLAELALRSGLVSHIHADIICDNDTFEENLGRVVTHKIDRRKARGEMYAAYSHVVMKDGSESFEIMSKDEIDGIRKRSKASGSGPWVTDYSEMAKKTVFRRHSKWLPLSPEFRDALDKDDSMPIDVNSQVQVSAPIVGAPQVADAQKVERPSQPKTEPKKRGRPAKQDAPPPAPDESTGPSVEDDIPYGDGEPEPQDPEESGPVGGPFASPQRNGFGLDAPE